MLNMREVGCVRSPTISKLRQISLNKFQDDDDISPEQICCFGRSPRAASLLWNKLVAEIVDQS